MTLILTGVFRNFVIQASDRLVSLMPDLRPGDALANKSLVYRGSDGAITLGFAGSAYLRDIPIDEWIAGVLRGEPIVRHDGENRPSAMQIGGGKPERISTVLHRLVEALSHSGFPLNHHLEIQGAGWRVRRGRIIPVSFHIRKTKGHRDAESAFTPRQPVLFGAYLGSAGVKIDRSELLRAMREHADVKGRSLSIEDVEELFVQFIRNTADNVAGVGKNILTVALTTRSGRSRFHAFEEHKLAIHSLDFRTQFIDCAHTPWVISPGLIRAPSIEVGRGSWELDLSGYEFEIGGGPPVEGPFQMMITTSLSRPKARELGKTRTPEFPLNPAERFSNTLSRSDAPAKDPSTPET